AGPPPLARIESVTVSRLTPRGDRDFQIAVSRVADVAALSIPADVATCAACLSELFDPADRRYRYPFITCTNCGPRLTIGTGAPYDRPQTTMADFDMCDACRGEYTNPSDRRFHAETIACAACGPRLRAVAAGGGPIAGDPLDVAAAVISSGGLVPGEGPGGVYLPPGATRRAALVPPRARKPPAAKPLPPLPPPPPPPPPP